MLKSSAPRLAARQARPCVSSDDGVVVGLIGSILEGYVRISLLLKELRCLLRHMQS